MRVCRCNTRYDTWSKWFSCNKCLTNFAAVAATDARGFLEKHRAHVRDTRTAYYAHLRDTLDVTAVDTQVLREILALEGMHAHDSVSRDMLEWRVSRLLTVYNDKDADLQLYFRHGYQPVHLWVHNCDSPQRIAPPVVPMNAHELAFRIPLSIWKQHIFVHLDNATLWAMHAVCRQFYECALDAYRVRSIHYFRHFAATPLALLTTHNAQVQKGIGTGVFSTTNIASLISESGSIDAIQHYGKYRNTQTVMQVLERAVEADFLQKNLDAINTIVLPQFLPAAASAAHFCITHSKMRVMPEHCQFQVPAVSVLASVFDGSDSGCTWNSRVFLSRCTSLMLCANRNVCNPALHEHQQMVRHLPTPFVQCFFDYITTAMLPATLDALVTVVQETPQFTGHRSLQFLVFCLARVYELRGAQWTRTIALPSIDWQRLFDVCAVNQIVVLDAGGVYIYANMANVYQNHSSHFATADGIDRPGQQFFVIDDKQQHNKRQRI